MLQKRDRDLRRSAIFLLMLGGVWLLAAPPAYAYLDPGTGSYLFQLLIAGLLGGGVALKIFWKQVAGFFKRVLRRRGSDPDDER